MQQLICYFHSQKHINNIKWKMYLVYSNLWDCWPHLDFRWSMVGEGREQGWCRHLANERTLGMHYPHFSSSLQLKMSPMGKGIGGARQEPVTFLATLLIHALCLVKGSCILYWENTGKSWAKTILMWGITPSAWIKSSVCLKDDGLLPLKKVFHPSVFTCTQYSLLGEHM